MSLRRRPSVPAALREINKLIGSVAGPFESWLTLRGLKTLPLRMKQQSDNAGTVATWLANDSRVSRVNYPDYRISAPPSRCSTGASAAA